MKPCYWIHKASILLLCCDVIQNDLTYIGYGGSGKHTVDTLY